PRRSSDLVVRTARLTRLARHARRDRAVPVGEVEDLSIGRAPALLVALARGGVDGVGITAPRHVSQVERRGYGMAEGRAVQGAPRPVRSVRSESAREVGDGFVQRRENQGITCGDRLEGGHQAYQGRKRRGDVV